MSIDKDTVIHIAKLARISLDEKKINSLSKDLSSIMKFIEKLNELNTEKTAPLSSIINASLQSRKDEVLDGKQSVVWLQALNRIHVQKSIIEWCLT